MLQAITALKLQAGVMEQGAAEAVAAEEHTIRCLLAALPPDRLPHREQLQLQQLGIHYGSSAAGAAAADAAEDFELPEDDAAALPGADSTDAKARELAEMAAHFSNSTDLSYALQHLDELSASSAAVAADGDDDGHMPGARLLSSAKATADAADGLQQQSSSLDMLLHLDQEFELQAEDLHASAAGDDSTRDDSNSSSAAGWGSSSGAGSSSRQFGSMQWPGGLAGGKVNVLGQLKSNRRAQMLPPSNKPLGKNVQIKPNLQVGLLQLCLTKTCPVGLLVVICSTLV
jgi:hypothetical protein